jgi:hypothetical protein
MNKILFPNIALCFFYTKPLYQLAVFGLQLAVICRPFAPISSLAVNINTSTLLTANCLLKTAN